MRFVPLLALLFLACEGPTGPLGPEGPEGEPGPGERVVIEGSTANTSVALDLAAFDPDSPPLVQCYRVLPEYIEPMPTCYFRLSDTWRLVASPGHPDFSYRVVLVY